MLKGSKSTVVCFDLFKVYKIPNVPSLYNIILIIPHVIKISSAKGTIISYSNGRGGGSCICIIYIYVFMQKIKTIKKNKPSLDIKWPKNVNK